MTLARKIRDVLYVARFMKRRLSVGIASLFGVIALLGGCNDDASSEASTCFPIPETGAVVIGRGTREVAAVSSGLSRPSPEHEMQGSELQGIDYQGMTPQGTSYQGRTPQGRTPQGKTAQGRTPQGRTPQGKTPQGVVFGLRDLNGARLEIADSAVPVRFAEGSLIATGYADTDALGGVALVGTATDGARFPVELAVVERTERIERVEVIIDGMPACAPGDEGVFVEGAWNETGAFVDEPDALTYACMSGVIAKCVNWGYAPWDVGTEMHQTCTRLARADYCGDGNSWTLNGTIIDIYDTHGIQTPVQDELSFEAAWGGSGALCINDTRYTVVDSAGDLVQPSCFASLPRCGSLAEAVRYGAVFANDSAHAAVATCE